MTIEDAGLRKKLTEITLVCFEDLANSCAPRLGNLWSYQSHRILQGVLEFYVIFLTPRRYSGSSAPIRPGLLLYFGFLLQDLFSAGFVGLVPPPKTYPKKVKC